MPYAARAMPTSKKRVKPEKKKRRDRAQAGGGGGTPAPASEGHSGGSGLLSGMRGGIQRLAGSAPQKKESLLSKILTWALVVVALWFLAKRFGILR